MAKLKIQTIPAGQTNTNTGTTSIAVVDDAGQTHTLEFTHPAQEQLLLALLACPPGNPPLLRYRPQGISRFQVGADVGISLLLNPQTGIHALLARPLANELQKLLETFDDKSTWNLGRPAGH